MACFIWLVVKEAALNQDNMRKRGISIYSKCYFSGKEAETINHPFLYCKVTSHLRKKGIRWAMPGWTMDFLSCWNDGGGKLLPTKPDGILAQQLFDGLSGRIETSDALKIQLVLFRRSRRTAFSFFVFGVKLNILMI